MKMCEYLWILGSVLIFPVDLNEKKRIRAFRGVDHDELKGWMNGSHECTN